MHDSSLAVLADLAEAWAAGLLVDGCQAARCGRLVICSLTQMLSTKEFDHKMDAAEILACAYCWPHARRGMRATAEACVSARRSIVDACYPSLQ